MLLETRAIHSSYGHVHVLRGVSIEINEGDIVAILGANGAGKSTLLKTICGIVPCRRGQVVYQGTDITSCTTEDLVQRGISFVPDGRELHADMSVWENLLLGSYANYSKLGKRALEERFEFVYDFFPRLLERREQLAGTLSGGEQQMLAIGRALMGAPKILLLDEPSNGLSPLLVRSLFEVIQQLRQTGVTVLLVEQSAGGALAVADRAYVLQSGEVVASGDAQRLRGRTDLAEVYLGRRVVPRQGETSPE